MWSFIAIRAGTFNSDIPFSPVMFVCGKCRRYWRWLETNNLLGCPWNISYFRHFQFAPKATNKFCLNDNIILYHPPSWNTHSRCHHPGPGSSDCHHFARPEAGGQLRSAGSRRIREWVGTCNLSQALMISECKEWSIVSRHHCYAVSTSNESKCPYYF